MLFRSTRIHGCFKGGFKEAGVDNFGHLLGTSVGLEAEGFYALSGQAFIIHAECHLSASAAGGFLSIKIDESDRVFVITRIFADAHTLTTPLAILQVKEPATTTGGTGISTSTSVGITNKNYTKGTVLSATITQSDGSSDLTYTGGQTYHSFPLASGETQSRDMKSTNILGKNDTILFGWKTLSGGNATNGEIVSISVNGYLVKKSDIREF